MCFLESNRKKERENKEEVDLDRSRHGRLRGSYIWSTLQRKWLHRWVGYGAGTFGVKEVVKRTDIWRNSIQGIFFSDIPHACLMLFSMCSSTIPTLRVLPYWFWPLPKLPLGSSTPKHPSCNPRKISRQIIRQNSSSDLYLASYPSRRIIRL